MLDYEATESIGAGKFGQVFKVKRKTDEKLFALKFTEPQNDEERKDILNEAKLIKILDCEQLITCEEVYEFDNRVWLILDYMEGGSMDCIVNDRKGHLSEEHVRWSLYNVALAI